VSGIPMFLAMVAQRDLSLDVVRGYPMVMAGGEALQQVRGLADRICEEKRSSGRFQRRVNLG
jgi:hypothetical protein